MPAGGLWIQRRRFCTHASAFRSLANCMQGPLLNTCSAAVPLGPVVTQTPRSKSESFASRRRSAGIGRGTSPVGALAASPRIRRLHIQVNLPRAPNGSSGACRRRGGLRRYKCDLFIRNIQFRWPLANGSCSPSSPGPCQGGEKCDSIQLGFWQ
jgi:hypothetical protein